MASGGPFPVVNYNQLPQLNRVQVESACQAPLPVWPAKYTNQRLVDNSSTDHMGGNRQLPVTASGAVCVSGPRGYVASLGGRPAPTTTTVRFTFPPKALCVSSLCPRPILRAATAQRLKHERPQGETYARVRAGQAAVSRFLKFHHWMVESRVAPVSGGRASPRYRSSR